MNHKVILYLVGCVEAASSSPLMLFRCLSSAPPRMLLSHHQIPPLTWYIVWKQLRAVFCSLSACSSAII